MNYLPEEITILKDYLPLKFGELDKIANTIQRILSRYLINRDEEGRDIDVYNIYAIKARTKSPESLIKKIRDKKTEKNIQINKDNYKDIIEDLVGTRIICYHPSDLEIIVALINGLNSSKIIEFVNPRQPFEKKCPFLMPAIPNEYYNNSEVVKTAGYSSIHSIIRLVRNPEHKIELQLRTLLEETWGEINHFHQYKKETNSPLVTQGFYIFSALLAACNLKVDYLKFEANGRKRPVIPLEENSKKVKSEMIENFDKPLMKIFKDSGFQEFQLMGRIFDYIYHRFNLHKDGRACPIFKYNELPPWDACFYHIFHTDIIKEFITIYEGIMGFRPFSWASVEGDLKNNTDLKNLVDFGICICENYNNKEICKMHLEFVLKKRKNENHIN